MVAQSVEQLKREYTDKYVKVDGSRPELARFRDVVGQVKTVNMSGRALVEFMDYHLNIGWFDIDLSFLTVVPKPTEEERAAAKASKAKPAGKAAPTTGAKQSGDAKAPTVAGTKAGGSTAKPATKLSVADMLAAARGGGGAAPAAAPAKEKPAAPAKAAAPKAAAPAKPAGKMSVAEMLAAARAGDAGGGAAAAPAAEAEAAPAPPKAAAPKPATAKAASGEIVRVDRNSMSVAEMVAYCREHDAG
jgi:hypothetical protein